MKSGLYTDGSLARMLHTTIARNGYGIYVTHGGSHYSTVVLTNTILVSHTVGITVTDTLPIHIMPGKMGGGTVVSPSGTITWTQIVTAPGGVWKQRDKFLYPSSRHRLRS